MLLSVRSTVLRSLSHRAYSVQVEANKDALGSIFRESSAPTPTPIASTPTPISSEPTIKPRIPTIFDVPPARDPLLDFITSRMMRDGKRARAAKTTSEILLHIHALTRAPPLPILREAVELAAPAVRVMRHKTGGKIVVKPVALNERQRIKAAIDGIIEGCLLGPEHTRAERMARECVRIVRGEKSKAVDNKEAQHRLAMVSRGNLPRMR